jgi:hypothetical protein
MANRHSGCRGMPIGSAAVRLPTEVFLAFSHQRLFPLNTDRDRTLIPVTALCHQQQDLRRSREPAKPSQPSN